MSFSAETLRFWRRAGLSEMVETQISVAWFDLVQPKVALEKKQQLPNSDISLPGGLTASFG